MCGPPDHALADAHDFHAPLDVHAVLTGAVFTLDFAHSGVETKGSQGGYDPSRKELETVGYMHGRFRVRSRPGKGY